MLYQFLPLMMSVYSVQLLSVATFFGAIFCFAAFCFKSLYAFIALFAIGELLVFATQVIYLIMLFVFSTLFLKLISVLYPFIKKTDLCSLLYIVVLLITNSILLISQQHASCKEIPSPSSFPLILVMLSSVSKCCI